MTSPDMSRQYIEEARGRLELVRMAFDRKLWSTSVREAQECVELFLKGALRLVGVEPARTHDVAELLRRESGRFPKWFQAHVDRLAQISTDMAGDRGLAFYGDEREGLGPRDLFDEAAGRKALGEMDDVAVACNRLLDELSAQPAARIGSGDHDAAKHVSTDTTDQEPDDTDPR